MKLAEDDRKKKEEIEGMLEKLHTERPVYKRLE